MAAGGENADGPLDDPATGQPSPIVADDAAFVTEPSVSSGDGWLDMLINIGALPPPG